MILAPLLTPPALSSHPYWTPFWSLLTGSRTYATPPPHLPTLTYCPTLLTSPLIVTTLRVPLTGDLCMIHTGSLTYICSNPPSWTNALQPSPYHLPASFYSRGPPLKVYSIVPPLLILLFWYHHLNVLLIAFLPLFLATLYQFLTAFLPLHLAW